MRQNGGWKTEGKKKVKGATSNFILDLKSANRSEKSPLSTDLLLVCVLDVTDEGYWVSRNEIQLNNKDTQIHMSVCVSIYT